MPGEAFFGGSAGLGPAGSASETTQGRGRCGTDKQSAKPNTAVWLRPLAKQWRRILHR